MKPFFEFFAKRHLLATLITFMTVLLGINTLMGIKRDVFPSVDFGELFVTTLYQGASPEDVELNVEDNILTLSSKKEESKEEKKNGYLIRERRNHEFARTFVLPKDVERDKIKAEFKDGLLVVNIPKKPEAKPRKIDVKSN